MKKKKKKTKKKKKKTDQSYKMKTRPKLVVYYSC